MVSSDWSGKRVLVIGLGVSGFAAARALVDLDAKVRVTEGSSNETIAGRAEALRAQGAEVEIGGHDLDALDADVAILSPGIPPTAPVVQALTARPVRILSEIELAFQLASCDFLAVTGTNGKTTTTSLLALMLERSGTPSTAAGNIGEPLVDAALATPAEGAIAVEASSFQLATIERFRPKVGVVLNVAEDHTDWHGSVEAYAAAKARIFENQSSDDVAIVNADDPVASRTAEGISSTIVAFSSRRVPEDGAGVAGDDIVVRGEVVAAVSDVSLPGRAGLEDAVAATAAARTYGIDAAAIRSALQDFRPLAHRFEVVARAGGVTYIDDSKATNPHATLAAVRALDDVVLIAGGRSKGIDLNALTEIGPSLRAVIALGEARDELARVFNGSVPVVVVDSMRDAVRAARDRANGRGSVLLSPACASLDMYESYAARGNDFAREVRELMEREGSEHGHA